LPPSSAGRRRSSHVLQAAHATHARTGKRRSSVNEVQPKSHPSIRGEAQSGPHPPYPHVVEWSRVRQHLGVRSTQGPPRPSFIAAYAADAAWAELVRSGATSAPNCTEIAPREVVSSPSTGGWTKSAGSRSSTSSSSPTRPSTTSCKDLPHPSDHCSRATLDQPPGRTLMPRWMRRLVRWGINGLPASEVLSVGAHSRCVGGALRSRRARGPRAHSAAVAATVRRLRPSRARRPSSPPQDSTQGARTTPATGRRRPGSPPPGSQGSSTDT
jgi:hypothetical protein